MANMREDGSIPSSVSKEGKDMEVRKSQKSFENRLFQAATSIRYK